MDGKNGSHPNPSKNLWEQGPGYPGISVHYCRSSPIAFVNGYLDELPLRGRGASFVRERYRLFTNGAQSQLIIHH